MKSRCGSVYFIKGIRSGMIKIGRCAGDPRKRLADLQVGSSEPLELIGLLSEEKVGTVERPIHRKFQSIRSHGEWFHPTAELVTFVEKACSQEGQLDDDETAVVIASAKDIASVIARSRMRAHLRQEDLARAVGVSRKWIIDIEGGKERAELWMVLKTLQVLGLSLSISVNRSAESS